MRKRLYIAEYFASCGQWIGEQCLDNGYPVK